MKKLLLPAILLNFLVATFVTPMHLFSLIGANHQHHFDQEVIVKQPTCTEPGLGYVACPEDGAKSEQVEIPPQGHHIVKKTVAPTCTKSGFDVYYCTRCGFEDHRDNPVESLGHHFELHEIPASCSHGGHIESYCTRCGIDEFDPYDTEKEEHEYVLSETIKPTCKEEGYDIYRCSKCGRAHYDNFVEPLGHDYHITHTEPTCVEGGYGHAECSRCGKVVERLEKEPLGHNWIHHEEIAPTCTGMGVVAFDECSRCGEIQGYKDLDPLGHNFEVVSIVPPTCDEQGYSVYECRNCHKTHNDDFVPALGHALVHVDGKTATCDQAGYKAYDYCTRCSYSTYEVIEPLGGEHHYISDVVAPTTYSEGYTTHTCLACGDTYVDSYVQPIQPMREETAEQAISSGHSKIKDPSKIVQSFRNDDAYFYLIYAGHVSDFPLHTNATIRMDVGTESLKTYPKSVTTPVATDIMERFEDKCFKLIQNGVSELTESPLISSIENVKKSNDKTLDQKIQSTFNENSFSLNSRQVSDPNFNLLTISIKSVGSAYEGLKKFFKIGYTYSYTIVSEVDIYIGAIYDLSVNEIEYRVLTEISNPQEKLFAIPTNEGGDVHSLTDTIEVSNNLHEQLVKPSTYKTSYPYIHLSGSHPDHVQLNYLDTWPYKYRNSDLRNYYEQGYDNARCILRWNWDRANSNPICYMVSISDNYVIDYQDGHYNASGDYQGWWTYDQPDTEVTWNFTHSLRDLLVYNGFDMVWKHGGLSIFSVLAQGVKSIYVDLYLYKESAYYEGAYKGTPIQP